MSTHDDSSHVPGSRSGAAASPTPPRTDGPQLEVEMAGEVTDQLIQAPMPATKEADRERALKRTSEKRLQNEADRRSAREQECEKDEARWRHADTRFEEHKRGPRETRRRSIAQGGRRRTTRSEH